jgi:hypothetical protein
MYKESLEGKDKQIFTEVEKGNALLDKEIQLIRDKQQELQRFITLTDSNLSFLEAQLSENKTLDNKAKTYLRKDIARNIEILNDLYNTYRGFEEVKFRYKKLVSENKLNGIKLIEVQVRQLNEKFDRFEGGGFMEVIKELSKMVSNKTDLPSLEVLDEDKYEV